MRPTYAWAWDWQAVAPLRKLFFRVHRSGGGDDLSRLRF